MNLMIVDEELIAGGVEAIQLNVIPELCSQVEEVYWLLPPARINYFRERLPLIENLHYINWNVATSFGERLLRWTFDKSLFAKEKLLLFLRNQKLKRFYQEKAINVCLTTCMFEQPHFPEGMVRAGILCDLNVQGKQRVNFLKSIKKWVENSEVVFPISQFTKKQLLELSPSFSSRLQTVPLGASFRKSIPSQESKDVMFYYPASIMPHKNHFLLFQAFQIITRERRGIRLILTGGGTEQFLSPEIHEDKHVNRCRDFFQKHYAELASIVEARGYVDLQEVNSLYDQSSCIILPSAMEGYGLPLAEALAAGKPVICSDIEPFREQVTLYQAEDRVRFFRNNSLESLINAMETFVEKPLTTMSEQEIKSLMARWSYKDVARSYLETLKGLVK